MTAREIIDYIRSLKRGFDKDLFQNKIDELSYIVDTVGLDYDEFHTLFKIWLNLTIPITKWTSLGTCLVPVDKVEERTVDYSLRWILANWSDESNFSRISFVLDWLTAAMECDCIDMTALDSGYDLFCNMLTYEALTTHAMKLVYTLTKPSDVTRRRVLELIDYAKKREAKKNMYQQLQVLLGLFKSYKPECVPENVPALSIHTAFKKLNVKLLARFKRSQDSRNSERKDRNHLIWINPINAHHSRNKKSDPLIPNMEFFNTSSKKYDDKEPQKNCLDFSDPVSLLQYHLHHSMSRPARLRALLCNEMGVTLLATASHADHCFLSHDLHHLLNNCLFDVSPHSHSESRHMLRRVSRLQRALLQAVPAVTRALARYLPLWNETDYFPEILELVEWISVECPEYLGYIVGPLTRIYHRAQPMEQCAILRALTNMYVNIVFASTKSRQHFLSVSPPQANYTAVLKTLAAEITNMCNKEIQINPDDYRVVYSTLWSAQRRAAAAVGVVGAAGGGVGALGALGALPAALTLAVPLLSASAVLIENTAQLFLLYIKVLMRMKSSESYKEEAYMRQIQNLQDYSADVLNCLYYEKALNGDGTSVIFEKLSPQLIDKLRDLIPGLEAKLSIRNHLAFAPYTYMKVACPSGSVATNKQWFESVIAHLFPNMGKFFKKTVPELRMVT